MDTHKSYLLLVEDEPGAVLLVTRQLAGLGLEIKSAAGAAQARAAIKEAAPLLMLLDYSLPGESAAEFIGGFKARGEAYPPFIVITGHSGEDVAVAMLKAGARDYLVKGGSFLDLLVPTVKRVLAELESERLLGEAHRELLESEARYRSLFEQARDSILLLEPVPGGVPVIRDANAAAVQSHGYTREELLGKPVSFLDADVPESVLRQRVKWISESKGALFEARHRRKDGTVFDLEVSVKGMDMGGKLLFLDISRDITERKRLEAELRQREERYKTILQTALDGFWLTDAQGRLLEVNEAACRMSGYSEQELKGMRISDLEAAEAGADTAAHMQKIIERGEDRFESRHRRKDGSVIHVAVSVQYRPAGGGRFVVFVQDITERELADAALRESEERYRLLYESSRDALMTLFPPDWRFTSGNPATIELFGAKDEKDFTSRGPWEVSPEYQPGGELSSVAARRRIAGAMDKGSDFFEWRHKKIGGPEFPATVLLTRFELGGKTGLQATVRDLSEQKRGEAERGKLGRQLLQAQKMETVGLLAGGVAHDFNNILSAIMCYSGFVAKKLAPDDPKLADIKEIQAAAERAAALTHQLLAFSRRQILAPKVVDINGLVGSMTRMLTRIIGENIKLELRLHPSPCLANVDPGQIEQVIMNLVLNASDAMSMPEGGGPPRGGTITLGTEISGPGGKFLPGRPDLAAGGLVCIKVRDTGCGMDEEVKKHLFEPFFTTKAQGKGTGLGLPVVFGIVKQSGGEIEAESEAGKGAAFSVYLPFVEACLKAKEKEAGLPAKGSETVLLAEDEASLRRIGERILRAGGYTVLAAADGQEALKLMAERGEPVDLLLTDVVMPGLSGRELAGELARRGLVRRVLYMSGYTDEAIVKHGVLEPGIAFIYKPFTADAVLLKLREVLDGPAEQAKP